MRRFPLLRFMPLWLLMLACVACYVRRAPDETIGKDLKTPVIHKDTLASDKRVARKKKIPKKTFYGLRTRKAFTKQKKGKIVNLELFFVLKDKVDPSLYVQNIYWYHRKKRKIMVGPIPEKDKKFGVILHGPYKKIIGRNIVEEGQFYVGTKTGRWEQYFPADENILADKKKYYKGFSKESEISYYDVARTRVKEVKPVEENRYQGDYFFYSEDGVLILTGKYEHNVRVGVWSEYYDDKKRKRIKKKIQYPETAYVTQFEPYTLYEYDKNGFATYDKAEEDKKLKDKKK